MGRKKKKVVKPWCWYCNREFDDEKILIQHQKAKHFKCHVCHKKLYTGPGLAIHCMQVHKEKIDKVPNSVQNRGSLEIEIYGTEGIPDEDQRRWEAQKLGKGDEPPEKLARDDASTSVLPGGAPGFMYAAPGMPMPGMPMPMPGYAAPVMPHMGAPMSNTGTGNSPSQLPPTATPTFPAYGTAINIAGTGVAPGIAAGALAKGRMSLMTQGTGTKIMHPDDDCSLEERRASLPRYAVSKKSRTAGSMGPVGPMSSTPSLMSMPVGYPMMGHASNYGTASYAYQGGRRTSDYE